MLLANTGVCPKLDEKKGETTVFNLSDFNAAGGNLRTACTCGTAPIA
jgi:hypothetical protein